MSVLVGVEGEECSEYMCDESCGIWDCLLWLFGLLL